MRQGIWICSGLYNLRRIPVQYYITNASANIGKSGNIVVQLLRPYLDKGHTVYVDNWYTSPALFIFLHKNGTNACGTVRKRHKGMQRMDNKFVTIRH